MNNELTGKPLARKPIEEMFDRAEALQNAAKAIKGLQALDDEALKVLYLEAKAERRARNTDMKEAYLNLLGQSKKVLDYPHIEIGFRSAQQISAESEGELSPYDASAYEGWYWTEYGYNGYSGNSASSLDTEEKAQLLAKAYLAESGLKLPIINVSDSNGRPFFIEDWD